MVENKAEFLPYILANLANSRMCREFAVIIMQLFAGQAAGPQIDVGPAVRYRIIKANALVSNGNERYMRCEERHISFSILFIVINV